MAEIYINNLFDVASSFDDVVNVIDVIRTQHVV